MRRFTILDMPQGSPEWLAARCGLFTASCAGDLLAKIKTGEAAARRDLRTRMVVERLTNVPQEDVFVSKDMERGTALESEARAAYEAISGNLVREVGFLAHTELRCGGSPDGVIGDFDGLLELKVPKSATHLRYLRTRTLPAEHLAQVTALLWLTEAPWLDFCSYDPRFPEALQTFLVRVQRTDVDVTAFELAVRLFLDECDKEYADVAALMQAAA